MSVVTAVQLSEGKPRAKPDPWELPNTQGTTPVNQSPKKHEAETVKSTETSVQRSLSKELWNFMHKDKHSEKESLILDKKVQIFFQNGKRSASTENCFCETSY